MNTFKKYFGFFQSPEYRYVNRRIKNLKAEWDSKPQSARRDLRYTYETIINAIDRSKSLSTKEKAQLHSDLVNIRLYFEPHGFAYNMEPPTTTPVSISNSVLERKVGYKGYNLSSSSWRNNDSCQEGSKDLETGKATVLSTEFTSVQKHINDFKVELKTWDLKSLPAKQKVRYRYRYIKNALSRLAEKEQAQLLADLANIQLPRDFIDNMVLPTTTSRRNNDNYQQGLTDLKTQKAFLLNQQPIMKAKELNNIRDGNEEVQMSVSVHGHWSQSRTHEKRPITSYKSWTQPSKQEMSKYCIPNAANIVYENERNIQESEKTEDPFCGNSSDYRQAQNHKASRPGGAQRERSRSLCAPEALNHPRQTDCYSSNNKEKMSPPCQTSSVLSPAQKRYYATSIQTEPLTMKEQTTPHQQQIQAQAFSATGERKSFDHFAMDGKGTHAAQGATQNRNLELKKLILEWTEDKEVSNEAKAKTGTIEYDRHGNRECNENERCHNREQNIRLECREERERSNAFEVSTGINEALKHKIPENAERKEMSYSTDTRANEKEEYYNQRQRNTKSDSAAERIHKSVQTCQLSSNYGVSGDITALMEDQYPENEKNINQTMPDIENRVPKTGWEVDHYESLKRAENSTPSYRGRPDDIEKVKWVIEYEEMLKRARPLSYGGPYNPDVSETQNRYENFDEPLYFMDQRTNHENVTEESWDHGEPQFPIPPEPEPEEKALEILDVSQYFRDDFDLNSLDDLDYEERIDRISVYAETFEDKVKNFEEEKFSLEYFVLDEKLMRLIEKLDKIKCDDDQVTTRKIEVIQYIKHLHNTLDQRAKED